MKEVIQLAKFIFNYRVPWVDTDALGIVHFSNYFRLCERTEQELFNSLKLDEKIFLPRVHAKCDFRYPLRFNQETKVSMSIHEIGDRHITFNYEIWNVSDNRLSAQCSIVVVPVDKNMNPAPLNENVVKKLEAYYEDQMK